MAANLCRLYLPRLASILTLIAGSHLHRSRRSGCVQRAIGQLALRDGAPARSSGLRQGAARNQPLGSFLGILPSKSVRPTGASRRLRPTEYPTFLTKIETQAPAFHNAMPWARCRIRAIAINTATIRSQTSSRERAATQNIGCVCFLTKGQDFRQSIAREPSEALAPAPDLVPLMPAEPSLICRAALMCPSQAQRAFSHKLARILGRAPRQDLIRT